MAAITNADSTRLLNIDLIDRSVEQREVIARKKATCPFLGSAVNSGDLGVRNSADRSLAGVEDIVALGDLGGGDLGSKVLNVFARGNHSHCETNLMSTGAMTSSVQHE